MPHHCKALIIHCMDFRLGKSIKKFLEEQGLLGGCDIVSVAGAIKDLGEFLWRQIDISKKLHGINQIIIIHHADCGAYGGRAAFASDEEERMRHLTDMKKASKLILAKYPNIEIKLVLAKILPDQQVEFEKITAPLP